MAYIWTVSPAYSASPITFTITTPTEFKFQFRGYGDTLRNVKLEQGSVATPYQSPTYADNLRACMRYFQRFGENGMRFGDGFFNSSTGWRGVLPIFVPMRISLPTLTYNSLGLYDGADGYAVSALSVGVPNGNGMWVSATLSGGVQFRPGELYCNSAGSFIAFDARL